MPRGTREKTLTVQGRFRDLITGPTRKMSANVKRSTSDAAQSYTKMGQSAQRLVLRIAAITGATVALTRAVRGTSDSIDQFARISNTSRDFAGNIDQIRNATNQLAVDTGTEITEVRRAFESVGKQYRDTAEAVRVTNEAVRLGVATFTDKEAAAKTLTVAMKAFGVETEYAGGVAAILARVAQTTGGSLTELDRSLGKIAPIATNAGLSFGETASVLIAMGEAGLRGGEALEGTRTLLGKIVAPTDTAKKKLRELGVELEFGSVEGGKFRERLVQLRDAIDDNAKVAEALGLSGQSLSQFLLLSARNAGAFKKALDDLTTAGDSFEDTFNRANDTFNSNYQALKNVGTIAIESFLLPGIERANQSIGQQNRSVEALALRWEAYGLRVTNVVSRIPDDLRFMAESVKANAEFIGETYESLVQNLEPAIDSVASTVQAIFQGLTSEILEETASLAEKYGPKLTAAATGLAARSLGIVDPSVVVSKSGGIAKAVAEAAKALTRASDQATKDFLDEAGYQFDRTGLGAAYDRFQERSVQLRDGRRKALAEEGASYARINDLLDQARKLEEARADQASNLVTDTERYSRILDELLGKLQGAPAPGGRPDRDEPTRRPPGGLNPFDLDNLNTDLTTGDRLMQAFQSSTESTLATMFDFTASSKATFADWARSLASSVGRVIAKLLALRLVEGGAKVIGNLFSASSATTIGSDVQGPFIAGDTSLATGANGGIARGGFRAFASGGIVRQPTFGLIGEGRFDEAVVPLPDGRNIPVRMEGGGGGGAMSVQITINAMDGASVERVLASQEAQRSIRTAVTTGRNQRLGFA